MRNSHEQLGIKDPAERTFERIIGNRLPRLCSTSGSQVAPHRLELSSSRGGGGWGKPAREKNLLPHAIHQSQFTLGGRRFYEKSKFAAIPLISWKASVRS